MTTNGLDIIEIRRIQADGRRELIRLDSRFQALISKLLEMRGEIKDPHTCQLVLHLGQRGDVKADVWKKGY